MKRFHSTYSLLLTLIVLLLISGMSIYSVLADQTPGAGGINNIIPHFSALLITNDKTSGVLLQSSGPSGIITDQTGIKSTGLLSKSSDGAGIFVSNDGSNTFITGIEGKGSEANGIGIKAIGGELGIYAEANQYGLYVSGITGLEAMGGEGGMVAIGENNAGISVDNAVVKGIYEYTDSEGAHTAEGMLGRYTYNNQSLFGVFSDAFISLIGEENALFSITNNADFGTSASIKNMEITQAFQSDSIDAPGLTAIDLDVNGNVDFDTGDSYYFKTKRTARVDGSATFLELGMTAEDTEDTAVIKSSSNNQLIIDDYATFKSDFYTDGTLTGDKIGDVIIRNCTFTNGTENSSSCNTSESLMSCSAEVSNTEGLSLKKVNPSENSCTALHSNIPSDGSVTISAYCFSSTNIAESTASFCASSNNTITGSITIKDKSDNNKNYTDELLVTLYVSATSENGIEKMCISNTSSCNTWETYATTKDWTLATGDDGTRTVYIWFQDKNDNNSSSYSDSIIYDVSAPQDGYVYVDGISSGSNILVKWGGFSDTGSGIDHYILSSNTKTTPSDCSTSGNTNLDVRNTNQYSFGGSSNTSYFFRLCAVDATENISKGATTNVTVPDESR